MYSFIHAFIQSTIFTLSLFHKNEPSITTAIHHNHPSIINHALHGPLSMAFVHARMPLPWLAHNGMEDIPLANNHLIEGRTYMRACIEVTTSSHTLNVLMRIFGGGDGGDIDHRVGTAASLLLRVDSWMTDLKAMMVMRVRVMIGRRMTYILHMYTQRQRTAGPKQKNKWDQDRSPITGNNHSKSIEEAGMSQSRTYTWRGTTSASCTQTFHNHQRVLFQDLHCLHYLKWNCNS